MEAFSGDPENQYNGFLPFIPKYYGFYKEDPNEILLENLIHEKKKNRFSYIDLKIGLSTIDCGRASNSLTLAKR